MCAGFAGNIARHIRLPARPYQLINPAAKDDAKLITQMLAAESLLYHTQIMQPEKDVAVQPTPKPARP